jgi:type I restriction enzyme S subunit
MPKPKQTYYCEICDVKSSQKAHHKSHCETEKHTLALEVFKLRLEKLSSEELKSAYRTDNINDIIENKVNGIPIIIKQKPNGEELWNISSVANNVEDTANYNTAKSELMRVIKKCHDILYKFGISGEKAQNDIMRILTLKLLEKQFNNTESQLYAKCEEFKDIKNYEEYMSYCCDIKKLAYMDTNIFRKWKFLVTKFLINILNQIYFEQDTSFNCRNENGIKDIIIAISEINITEDSYTTVSGDIHEMFLAYGGKKSAKQFGQFFTPRKLIDCMYYGIKDIAPEYISVNPSSLVYDPCMGTAGFLTRFYNLVNPINGTIEVESKNFYGCEMEQDTIKQGVMNMYSATGNLSSNIFQCNSLSENSLVFTTKMDNIITNPPFGTKCKYDDLLKDFTNTFTEKFETEEQRISKFKEIYPLKVNNGACLFIQHCVYMLKEGGHCIIVLPDGELFEGSSKWSKDFRNWWCSSVNITHILSVPGGTFDHAGVKTNVVFFKKSGSAESIRFMETTKECNIIKDVFTIDKEDLKASGYSLNVETYKPEKVENYDVPMVKLGDVLETIKTGKDLTKAEQQQNIGDIPYIGSGNKQVNKINKYLINGKYIITGRVGTIGNFEVVNGKYWINGNAHYFNTNSNTNFDYIYYYLKFNNCILYNIIKGTNERKRVNIEDLKNIKIPLPSLEVQEQIVKELDELQEHIDSQQQHIERLKKQVDMAKTYVNYEEITELIKDCEKVKLGDIMKLDGNGKTNSKDITNTNEYSFYSASLNNPSGTHNNYDFDGDNYLLIVKSGGSSSKPISRNYGIGKVFKVSGKIACNIAVFKLSLTSNNNLNYLYKFLDDKQLEIQKLAKYATNNGNIDMIKLMNIKIPLPSLEIQEQIVKLYEEREKQVNETETLLKAEEKQLEQLKSFGKAIIKQFCISNE